MHPLEVHNEPDPSYLKSKTIQRYTHNSQIPNPNYPQRVGYRFTHNIQDNFHSNIDKFNHPSSLPMHYASELEYQQLLKAKSLSNSNGSYSMVSNSYNSKQIMPDQHSDLMSDSVQKLFSI